jgi:drug/metabolite transporter (DMT)-like permease
MTETVSFTPRRTISSGMILAALLLIAASMALGFGIRSWTQTEAQASTPAAVRVAPPVTTATIGSDASSDPGPILRMSGPR